MHTHSLYQHHGVQEHLDGCLAEMHALHPGCYASFLDTLPLLLVSMRMALTCCCPLPACLQIPTIGFLYVAGYIGYVGRNYLNKVKASMGAKAIDKEIIIDVPLALK